MNRGHEKDNENPTEIESQFILRMPLEPAKALREVLRSGATNLKDRFAIKLENDVRYGEVRMDHWLMPAKVVDLPTITESLKTIDNKSFYKTADICQMLYCKEEDDQTTDEEVTLKTKKKDPNKVEKKFLWPHGITPPAKNVRRRRFRKTLKKKYVEAPEIEKEVKRLLRVDNDAVSVKYEVISEDDEHHGHNKIHVPTSSASTVSKGVFVKVEQKELAPEESADVSLETSNQDQQSLDIEHDIFGGAVSDSDEDETNINILELDETSHLSGEIENENDVDGEVEGEGEDSHLSDSCSLPIAGDTKSLVTEFTSEMFHINAATSTSSAAATDTTSATVTTKLEPAEYDINIKNELHFNYNVNQYLKAEPDSHSYLNQQLPKEKIYERMEQLQLQLAELRTQREQHEMEIVNIENHALRQRFQDILDNLLQKLIEKEQEYQQLQEMLKIAYKDM